jgi:hypothetical protein
MENQTQKAQVVTAVESANKHIRADRNSFYHLDKLLHDNLLPVRDLLVDALLFINYKSQTSVTDLEGFHEATTDEFLKFTGRKSRSSLFYPDLVERNLVVQINNQDVVLKNAFEYTLHALAFNPVNIGGIYSKPGITVSHFEYEQFLSSFSIREVGLRKKRSIGFKVNPIFANSLLKQYFIINPDDLAKLRGKRNSAQRLYIELVKRTIQYNVVGEFFMYYPVIKNICNINIESFTPNINKSRTIAKIKKQIDEIQELTELEISYKVDPITDIFYFKVKSKNKRINNEMHSILLMNSLQTQLYAFLDKNDVKTIDRLSDEEKITLALELCKNYEADRLNPDYRNIFETTLFDLLLKQVEFRVIIEETEKMHQAALIRFKEKKKFKN